MKANVSVMDSIIGVALSLLGFEPSIAHASRGCTNNRPRAIALIASMRRDPFILIIFRTSFEHCENALRSSNRAARVVERTAGFAPRGIANVSYGLKPSTRVF